MARSKPASPRGATQDRDSTQKLKGKVVLVAGQRAVWDAALHSL